jgi:hypothetical protein
MVRLAVDIVPGVVQKYSIAGCVARGTDALFVRLCGETASRGLPCRWGCAKHVGATQWVAPTCFARGKAFPHQKKNFELQQMSFFGNTCSISTVPVSRPLLSGKSPGQSVDSPPYRTFTLSLSVSPERISIFNPSASPIVTGRLTNFWGEVSTSTNTESPL